MIDTMSYAKKGCLGLSLLLTGVLLLLLYPFFFGRAVASKSTVELMRLKVFGMALHGYFEKNRRLPESSGELQPLVEPEPLVGSYDNIAEHLALYHDFETGEQKPWWIIAAAADSKDRVLFVVAPGTYKFHEKRVRLVMYSDCSAMQMDDAECSSQLKGKQISQIR